MGEKEIPLSGGIYLLVTKDRLIPGQKVAPSSTVRAGGGEDLYGDDFEMRTQEKKTTQGKKLWGKGETPRRYINRVFSVVA